MPFSSLLPYHILNGLSNFFFFWFTSKSMESNEPVPSKPVHLSVSCSFSFSFFFLTCCGYYHQSSSSSIIINHHHDITIMTQSNLFTTPLHNSTLDFLFHHDCCKKKILCFFCHKWCSFLLLLILSERGPMFFDVVRFHDATSLAKY